MGLIQAGVKFRNIISELSADKIILLSTHIVSDEAIAKEILILKDGNFVERGSAKELLHLSRGSLNFVFPNVSGSVFCKGLYCEG